MKKYILFPICALALSVGFVSCDVETNEEPGGTAIEKMCGDWDVTYNVIDGDQELVDPFGIGTVLLSTYNTAANETDKMWIDDHDNFWSFKFKCPINYRDRSFSCEGVDYDQKGSGKTTVTGGKILNGAGKNLHGNPVDSISFYMTFTDDDQALTYHVTGIRHEGWIE